MHISHSSHKVENLHTSSSASPHDQNIDPAIAGTGIMSTSAGESGGDDNGSDGKKGGKRELSTSKRAAQNRAAQVCVGPQHRYFEVVNGGLTSKPFSRNYPLGCLYGLLTDDYSVRSDNGRKATSSISKPK